MLRLSGGTIINSDGVGLGGHLSNIRLMIVMLRLSGYTTFNCNGVG